MTTAQLTTSPARARAGLSDARMLRSEYLISVTEGLLTPLDVIEAAALTENKALRRITLRQLVLSQPRVGATRSHAFLSAVAARLSTSTDIGAKTIAWLTDPRAGGSRLLAWLDAAHSKSVPWPGFPAAPRPQQVKTHG